MISKSVTMALALFTLMVLVVPSGVLQGALAQIDVDADTTIQDSSADDNILANENTFGDDLALIDQDNLADQDAANVGIQDQDLTQDQVQDQFATNFNFDFDFQYGFQVDTP